MHPRTRTLKQMVLAIAIGVAVLSVTVAPVRAETAAMASTPVAFTEAEQAMIAENPALKGLGEGSPDVLRQVLDLIAAALQEERTGRGGLGGLEREDVEILGRNPALLQVWQSSPEASADLLALIRAAAGSGKGQK